MKRLLLLLLITMLFLPAACQPASSNIHSDELSFRDRVYGEGGFVFETYGSWGAGREKLMKELALTEDMIVDMHGRYFKYKDKLYIRELDVHADVVFTSDTGKYGGYGGGRYIFTCSEDELDDIIKAISEMLRTWEAYPPMEEKYPFAAGGDEEELLNQFYGPYPPFIYRIHEDDSWMKLQKVDYSYVEPWDIEENDHIFILQIGPDNSPER